MLCALWTFPLQTKEAPEVAFYVDQFVSTYGVPSIFHSDNGGEFVNCDIDFVFEENEMTVLHGRERHPQIQGKVETVNKSLKDFLCKMHEDSGLDWVYLLADATSAYNNSYNSSIKTSPYEALFGRKKRTKGGGFQTRHRGVRARESTSGEEEVQKKRRKLQLIRESCTTALENARQKMIRGQHGTIPVLVVGDVVRQFVPAWDRGKSIGIQYVIGRVFTVLNSDCYRIMYKNGAVSQRGAHISSLERVDYEIWDITWASLDQVRPTTKIPLRSAARLYHRVID